MSINKIWMVLILLTSAQLWSGEDVETLHSVNCSVVEGYAQSSVVFSALTGKYWQIWQLDVTKGEAIAITHSPIDKRTPRYSQDGKNIVYRDSSGKVFNLNLETKIDMPITPISGYIMDPQISRSGEKLAFARFQSAPNDNTDIYIYDMGSKALNRITDEATLEYAPAWSSDERKIAYIGGRGARGHLLYVIDLQDRSVKRLQDRPSDDMCPTWSPNDKWIAFSSSRTEDYEIWRVRPDGTEIQQLTHSRGLDSMPTFSPNGAHILFTSNRDGTTGLWLMKEDGSDQRRITPNGVIAREPHWWAPEALEAHK